MAKSKMSPQDIADKQIKRSQAAVGDYKAGIESVVDNPMKKAADAQDRWADGVNKALILNKFADGCNSVTLEEWKQKASTKGAASYASGVSGSRDKIVDFQTQRQSAQASIDARLASMPRGDLSQNLQRMIEQVQGMANFKFKKRRK